MIYESNNPDHCYFYSTRYYLFYPEQWYFYQNLYKVGTRMKEKAGERNW